MWNLIGCHHKRHFDLRSFFWKVTVSHRSLVGFISTPKHLVPEKHTDEENTVEEKRKKEKLTAVSLSADDGLGLWSLLSHLLWKMMKQHAGGVELPGPARRLLHYLCLINERSLFSSVKWAAAHCISSAATVHLTVPAATDRWRKWGGLDRDSGELLATFSRLRSRGTCR